MKVPQLDDNEKYILLVIIILILIGYARHT